MTNATKTPAFLIRADLHTELGGANNYDHALLKNNWAEIGCHIYMLRKKILINKNNPKIY